MLSRNPIQTDLEWIKSYVIKLLEQAEENNYAW